MTLPIAAQMTAPSGMLLFGSALSWAGGSVFDLMMLCMVAHGAYDYRMSGAVINGFARGATLGASALGAIVGWQAAQELWGDTLAMTAFSQAILLLAIVSAALFLGRRRLAALKPDAESAPRVYEVLAPNPAHAGARHASGAVTGEDPNEVARTTVVVEAGDGPEELEPAAPTPEELARQAEEYREQRIAAVAQAGGLSKRESDVFALIARGRSVPFIAERLVLSENTVNSHVRRIYRKLEISSKQELLDLIESSPASPGGDGEPR